MASKVFTNRDVVDCLRFYVMLTIILSANGHPESYCQKSLKEYIAEGESWHHGNQKIIDAHVEKAYHTLSGEFLKQHGMTYLGGREDMKFINREC